MITTEQLAAVERRYPNTVKVEERGLRDLDSGVLYIPGSLRDALGWIWAGSSTANGNDTALGSWWHRRGPAGELVL